MYFARAAEGGSFGFSFSAGGGGGGGGGGVEEVEVDILTWFWLQFLDFFVQEGKVVSFLSRSFGWLCFCLCLCLCLWLSRLERG